MSIKTIPAMVFAGGVYETEIRKRALIANIARKDLTLEEKGEGLVEYYKSGGVDPEHAISYFNTLRQKKQTKDRISTRASGTNSDREGGGRGRPTGTMQNEIALKNPQEYARFLELHKKLGIARLTQYQWMTQVVFIAPEVRKSPEFQSLSYTDKRLVTASEVRHKPDVQKQMVSDLTSIDRDYEKAKRKRKKENVQWTVDEFKTKARAKKKQVLKEYIPTYDNEKKITVNNFLYYGEVNGHISRLWAALTMGEEKHAIINRRSPS